MTDRMRRLMLLVLLAVATIGCDRVTKTAATRELAGKPDRTYLADTVRLEYAENTGGFVGLGESLPANTRRSLFVNGTGALILIVALYALRFRREPWVMLAATLYISGALSNWIDRVARNYVVDFMNVGAGPIRTGIFNVADMAIMAGIAIFVLASHRTNKASVIS